MEGKYKILWLDDVLWQDGDFVEELEIIKLLHPDFNIKQVSYVDKCLEILENHLEKYDAVILDVYGVYSNNPSGEPSVKGFFPMLELAKEKGLQVYVYSGEISRDLAEGNERERKVSDEIGMNNIFYKSEGPYGLMDKIQENLDRKKCNL